MRYMLWLVTSLCTVLMNGALLFVWNMSESAMLVVQL